MRSVLYGGTHDADFFSRNGPINIWFNSVGFSRYRNVSEVLELKQVQQDLSAAADSLFSLYDKGKIDEAQNGLGTIEKLSERFLQLLSKLEGKLAA
ncbi:histidine kinase [Rufibacter hautae]|uniref:histidine kinase n=1 Tax=Rufibacter hautae TaxID=2595005 RepID=UPI001CC1C29E|nr:histidine kinase [Rufibacter hautae]